MIDYDEMLEKGKEELPEEIAESSRFKVPKVKGHIQGNKTIVNNFVDIAKKLGRDPEHLLKYVLKELATPGKIVKQACIFGKKISASKINRKIADYADKFLFCPSCGKPDTEINKENNIYTMKCKACGARHSINTDM